MGRKKKEIDPSKIHELSSRGMTQKEMAKVFNVSHVTLGKRMGILSISDTSVSSLYLNFGVLHFHLTDQALQGLLGCNRLRNAV